MKRGNWNSAGREGPEWPSRATNRPKTSARYREKERKNRPGAGAACPRPPSCPSAIRGWPPAPAPIETLPDACPHRSAGGSARSWNDPAWPRPVRSAKSCAPPESPPPARRCLVPNQFLQQSVQALVEGMPAAAANIGGGDPQSLLALPLLSCAPGHAIALRNPIKHFSTSMFYRAGHLQSIRRLLPQADRHRLSRYHSAIAHQ